MKLNTKIMIMAKAKKLKDQIALLVTEDMTEENIDDAQQLFDQLTALEIKVPECKGYREVAEDKLEEMWRTMAHRLNIENNEQGDWS